MGGRLGYADVVHRRPRRAGGPAVSGARGSSSPLELAFSRVGDVVVVTVSGEVDMNTAADLVAALERPHEACSRVVADLSALGFLDSSGLNALVLGRRHLAARDIAFRVVSPVGGVVRRALEITGLVESLDVVDTLEHALA